MRVSPKYIIQLCQKGSKLHKGHTSIRKGRRSIAYIAGTHLVKGSRRKGQRKGRPRSKDRVGLNQSNKTGKC